MQHHQYRQRVAFFKGSLFIEILFERELEVRKVSLDVVRTVGTPQDIELLYTRRSCPCTLVHGSCALQHNLCVGLRCTEARTVVKRVLLSLHKCLRTRIVKCAQYTYVQDNNEYCKICKPKTRETLCIAGAVARTGSLRVSTTRIEHLRARATRCCSKYYNFYHRRFTHPAIHVPKGTDYINIILI